MTVDESKKKCADFKAAATETIKYAQLGYVVYYKHNYPLKDPEDMLEFEFMAFDIKNGTISEFADIDGHVKWDGCMNVKASDHFCSVRMAGNFCAVLGAIYKKALECGCDVT